MKFSPVYARKRSDFFFKKNALNAEKYTKQCLRCEPVYRLRDEGWKKTHVVGCTSKSVHILAILQVHLRGTTLKNVHYMSNVIGNLFFWLNNKTSTLWWNKSEKCIHYMRPFFLDKKTNKQKKQFTSVEQLWKNTYIMWDLSCLIKKQNKYTSVEQIWKIHTLYETSLVWLKKSSTPRWNNSEKWIHYMRHFLFD